jgi:hypothetical protein
MPKIKTAKTNEFRHPPSFLPVLFTDRPAFFTENLPGNRPAYCPNQQPA